MSQKYQTSASVFTKNTWWTSGRRRSVSTQAQQEGPFERLFSASADEIFEAISRLEIINISLNYGDNPQLIFEGLNSTGLDLSEGDKKATIKSIRQKEEIITYLTNHVSAKNSDIAELLGVKSTRAKKPLSELIADEIVAAEGGNRNRTYRLKS